jgi:hypothetical protein
MEEARGEAGGEAEQQHGDNDYQQHSLNRAAAPPTGVEQDTGVAAMERGVELTSEIGGGGPRTVAMRAVPAMRGDGGFSWRRVGGGGRVSGTTDNLTE